MSGFQRIEPDLEFINEIKKAGGVTLKKCYQCATCSSVCALSSEDSPFPRKQMLQAGWGRVDKLVADPDVWMCYQCNDCTTYCPRGARPGDVLAAIRAYIYQYYAFPRFMGRALANPKALPWLLLVPTLILLACVFLFAKVDEVNGGYLFLNSSTIDFDYFLRHSAVDALFVIGNIMIFCFAAIGFFRFWKALHGENKASVRSFISACFCVFKEVLSHSRFKECGQNRPRTIGHMLLLYGFIGAMFTTGAVFLFIFIPHYLDLLGLSQFKALFPLPIDLPHPVKILGALSGLALVVGGAMLIYRRLTYRDQVGANGYPDLLFLYMMFLVGLTGMLSWLTRLSGIPMLAYVNYFIHLIVVFFLLWYMPYSKFAHMIYRALALVYASKVGREIRA